MINLYINNEKTLVDNTASLQDLLIQNNYAAEHLAIALNQKFVPRCQFAQTQLHPEDRIDIIVPMQGG